MERGAGWEWGRAVIEEAGWEPVGHGGRKPNSMNSLNSYRAAIADAEGIDPEEIPSEQALRARALAFYYAANYRDQIAVSTGYEAAVAMMSEQWSGSIDELMEAARDERGRITVDGIRAVRSKSPATIKRPGDAVDHLQAAADGLRKGGRMALETSLSEQQTVVMLEILRQTIRVAQFLIERLSGNLDIESELEALLNVETAD